MKRGQRNDWNDVINMHSKWICLTVSDVVLLSPNLLGNPWCRLVVSDVGWLPWCRPTVSKVVGGRPAGSKQRFNGQKHQQKKPSSDTLLQVRVIPKPFSGCSEPQSRWRSSRTRWRCPVGSKQRFCGQYQQQKDTLLQRWFYLRSGHPRTLSQSFWICWVLPEVVLNHWRPIWGRWSQKQTQTEIFFVVKNTNKTKNLLTTFLAIDLVSKSGTFPDLKPFDDCSEPL